MTTQPGGILNLPELSVIAVAGQLWTRTVPVFRPPAWVCGDQDLSDTEMAVLPGVVLREGA